MPRFPTDCYLMDAAAADILAATPLGPLQPVSRETDPSVPFVALDDFDRTLRRSDRFLMESAGTVTLVQAGGSVVHQPGPGQGQLVTDLREGLVKAALADLSPLRSLLPAGSGQTRRVTAAFVDDEGKSHCRAHFHYLSTTAGKTVAIASLQGLRGYARGLADLRVQVLAHGGTALDLGALSFRLFPDQPAYDAKPAIPLRADSTALEAASDIIAAYIPVARANEAGIIADHDSEFLHDYRIALRKIRSVLSLFKGVYSEGQTAALKARFAALMDRTGRLRDLDVYLLERQRSYDLLPQSLHAGLDAKFALLQQERLAAKGHLVRHLRSERYSQDISALADMFADRAALLPGPTACLPAGDFASRLIWKRYLRICRIARVMDAGTDDAEVHALRIEGKKLRYLMEFFGPLFPKEEVRTLIRPLKALQDNLGLVNDCAVQQANLQLFLQDATRRGRKVTVDMAQSVGALTAVLHRRQAEERARTATRLSQFISPGTKQTFASLFHLRKES